MPFHHAILPSSEPLGAEEIWMTSCKGLCPIPISLSVDASPGNPDSLPPSNLFSCSSRGIAEGLHFLPFWFKSFVDRKRGGCELWRLKGLNCAGKVKKNSRNTMTVNAQTPETLGHLLPSLYRFGCQSFLPGSNFLHPTAFHICLFPLYHHLHYLSGDKSFSPTQVAG